MKNVARIREGLASGGREGLINVVGGVAALASLLPGPVGQKIAEITSKVSKINSMISKTKKGIALAKKAVLVAKKIGAAIAQGGTKAGMKLGMGMAKTALAKSVTLTSLKAVPAAMKASLAATKIALTKAFAAGAAKGAILAAGNLKLDSLTFFFLFNYGTRSDTEASFFISLIM